VAVGGEAPPRGRRAGTIALAAGALLFLAWLPSLLEQRRHGRYAWIGDFDVVRVLELPGALFFNPSGVLFALARIALTVSLVVGAVLLLRRPRGSAIVALGVLPIVGAALVSALGEPVFDERNMLVVAPFLAIIVAGGLTRLPRRLVHPVAAVGFAAAAAGSAFTLFTFGRIEYDRIAESLVAEGWTVDDSILISVPHAPTSMRVAVGWYLPRHPALTPSSCEDRQASLFAIGHSSVFDPWLARHSTGVEAAHRVASYDHPSRGRENGQIIVARLRPLSSPPGSLVQARHTIKTCARSSASLSAGPTASGSHTTRTAGSEAGLAQPSSASSSRR
jgi:hypothetical protein